MKMVTLAVRGPRALRQGLDLCGFCQEKSLALSELKEHFAQFGHVWKCTVPFDKETGFHRGMDWTQFSSELKNAVQQENCIIDGVKLHIQAQRPKVSQGNQIPDERFLRLLLPIK